ncbi:retrovirus-related pol polyprotein from transposon TNT 1-94 [Tanacetum coccineum]
MNKHHEESARRSAEMEEWIKKLQENAEINTRNQSASLKNLETQIEQLTKELYSRTVNEAPSSSTGQCKVVNADHEMPNIPISSSKLNNLHGKPFLSNSEVAQNEEERTTEVLIYDKEGTLREISLGVDRQEQQVKKKLRLDENIPVKHFCKPVMQTYDGKVIDYFEEALDPNKDPMERSFDDYKWVFDLEIEQLANEYELGIGKKGHILEMIWENCKKIQGKAKQWWYDYWIEEDEKQENGDKEYDLPMVLAAMRQSSRPTRPVILWYILWKPSRDYTRPVGPPSGLKGLLHMLNATVIPTKDIDVNAPNMFMAKIQEVTPDAANNSGPIFDDEPLQKLKFLGAVKFRNDQFAPILGYGGLVQGNVTIKRVYYVKGLNHNLFFVGQLCDADLEVAFQKSTCYVCDLNGNDILTAWLWHRRLSHLNFNTINLISKNDIVIGLPKLKFVKDHLCSSCDLGKAKRKSFKTKTTPSSKRRLQLLHMDLCGPMRVESINDETLEVLIDFLRLVQKGLHAQVRTVQTDKDTEFLNKNLHEYFSQEGIEHQTSTATLEQNGIVERRNRTLVEAARTMLSAAKAHLFFWAEAIATACFTQNRSLVIPRHEKTPYHVINGQKLSVKFFHTFSSLCYIVRDGENLDKMKEKGDA